MFGYLDDFIVFGPTELECKRSMSILIDLLQELGFVVALRKVVPPAQRVTYLGIVLDSVEMSLSLPPSKVDKLRSVLQSFENKVTCSVKDLQVLAGHLSHASTVVRGGRTFSRRVINFLKHVSFRASVVNIPEWFKEDIHWWLHFIEVFNGSAKMIRDIPELEVPVETDSSMTGFAAKWGSYWLLGVWHSPFPPDYFPREHWANPPFYCSSDLNINVLELWPIVCAAKRWGHLWKGRKVRVYTDNTQVLMMINTGRSSNLDCMCWLRELFWLSFLLNFHIVSSHILSVDNVIPDFLSRLFDPKRRGSIPSNLTQGLCCYRFGGVEDQVASLST